MKIGNEITFKRHYYDMTGLGGIIPQFLDKYLPFLLPIFYKKRIDFHKGEKVIIKEIFYKHDNPQQWSSIGIDMSKLGYKNGTMWFDSKWTEKYFFTSQKQLRKQKLKSLWKN